MGLWKDITRMFFIMEMKNIKKPAYAVKLGKGMFMAAQPTYQCQYCGKTAYTPSMPSSNAMLPCSAGHNYHYWVKC